MRLLEQVTGRMLSADSVAHHLERVGFPVEQIIELLPSDSEIRTARITGKLKDADDGIILTAETKDERHNVYSATEVVPESVVGIAFAKSPIAKDVLAEHKDAAAVVVTEKDLGLEDDRPVILPQDTPLGETLSNVIETTVLDVEITPNRGDLYSVYGLARELSVLWGERFNPPAPPVVDISDTDHPFKLTIEAEEDVHQYYGFVIEGVRVTDSPFWLRWLLHAFGARPVNNVVDVTNYVTFLTGQPLHAFDSARIHSSHVKVCRAAENQGFTAIDHRSYKLSSNCLLIADEDHPLALAGIMGGEDSEVSENTVMLFLESAEFAQQSTRQGIEKTGLLSESGKRFAAGVDGAMVRSAGLVFIDTLTGINPGLVVKAELAYGASQDKGSVSLGLAKLDSYAATHIDPKTAKKSLELIGFEVELAKDALKAKVPSHRNDIIEDVDIIEEVLRLSGYDDLPSRFEVRAESIARRHALSKRFNQIREFLSGLGLKEVYSLSLIPEADIPVEVEGMIVPITNPLSERMRVLRPLLLPSMLAVAGDNIRFGNADLALYEIGNVFTGGNDSPRESTHLGVLVTGNLTPLRWNHNLRSVDFFDLKGIVEMFFERFGIEDARFEVGGTQGYFKGESAGFKIGDASTVELGLLSPDLLEHFDIAQEVYFCEADLTALERLIKNELSFEELSRFNTIQRDMALLLDADYSAAEVLQFVRDKAGPLCTKVDVFDSYAGTPLPKGKRNLGLRLYFMPPDANLTKEELDRIMAKTGELVAAEFSALVRGREGNGS
jgi:phenylalanyl-tRNA synthetase beta chain